MKIVFLDIDGVLNSDEYFNSDKGNSYGFSNEIDESRVELLKEIIDATGSKIVLTSSWRNFHNYRYYKNKANNTPTLYFMPLLYSYLIGILYKYGLYIFSETRYIEGNRPREIRDWISLFKKKHKGKVESVVILDDDFREDEYDLYGLKKSLIKTDFYGKNGGLQKDHVEKAIKILNG